MSDWLTSLANASVYGGLFVLGVGAFCLVFRRLPAWVRSWLWCIACAQFLVRLVLSVPVTVPVPVAATEPSALVSDSTRAPSFVIDGSRGIESTPEREPVSPSFWLVSLWGIGVLAGSAVAARRLYGAWRLVRGAKPVEDPAFAGMLDGLAVGLRRRPRLMESARVKCPLLVGCLRPTIVVPTGYAAAHEAAEIRMAFAHEVAHIRRGDPWMSLLVATAQTVFFFHPFVWWAGRESSLAREEACDLDVIRHCAESPHAYAHFLLKSAQARTPVAGLGAAYGYRNLRRRITMLKGLSNASLSSPRRTWIGLIAAGLAASLPWTVVGQSAPAAAPAPQTSQAARAIAPKAPSIAKASKKRVVKKGSATAKAAAPKAAIAPNAAPSPAKAAIAPMDAPSVMDPTAYAAPARSENQKAAIRSISPVAMATGMPSDSAVAAAVSSEAMDITFAGPDQGSALQRRVKVSLVNADIKASIVKLLTESGGSFVIKAKIRPGTITGRFNNMPLDDVLRAIFRSIDQELTWQFDGDVIYILERGAPVGFGGGGIGGGIGAPSSPGGLGGGGFGGGAGAPGLGGGGLGESVPAGGGSGANGDPVPAVVGSGS